eukprot:gene4237-14668_t
MGQYFTNVSRFLVAGRTNRWCNRGSVPALNSGDYPGANNLLKPPKASHCFSDTLSE